MQNNKRIRKSVVIMSCLSVFSILSIHADAKIGDVSKVPKIENKVDKYLGRVTININGKSTIINAKHKKVGDILKDAGIELTEEDFVKPALDEEIVFNGFFEEVITIHKHEKESFSKFVEIPYEVVEIENSSLNKGERRVKQKGFVGVKKVTGENIIAGGEVFSNSDLEYETITEPIKEIVEVGTKNNVVLSYDPFTPSGLTEDEFERLKPGLGKALYDMEQDSGVNGIFCLAVGHIESSWKHQAAPNNFWGIKKTASTYRSWSSPYEGILGFGRYMSGRGLYNGKTISQISKIYCPPNSNNWANGVVKYMNKYNNQINSWR